MKFSERLRIAKLVVAQIKAGEWVPRYNNIAGHHLTAYRNNVELWMANGPFFCAIHLDGQNVFGYLLRHYVWWVAARKLKVAADKKQQQEKEKSLYKAINELLR